MIPDILNPTTAAGRKLPFAELLAADQALGDPPQGLWACWRWLEKKVPLVHAINAARLGAEWELLERRNRGQLPDEAWAKIDWANAALTNYRSIKLAVSMVEVRRRMRLHWLNVLMLWLMMALTVAIIGLALSGVLDQRGQPSATPPNGGRGVSLAPFSVVRCSQTAFACLSPARRISPVSRHHRLIPSHWGETSSSARTLWRRKLALPLFGLPALVTSSTGFSRTSLRVTRASCYQKTHNRSFCLVCNQPALTGGKSFILALTEAVPSRGEWQAKTLEVTGIASGAVPLVTFIAPSGKRIKPDASFNYQSEGCS